MSGGRKANEQGDKFRDILCAQIEAAGLSVKKEVRVDGASLWDDRGFIKIDLVIESTKSYPAGIGISVKWQDSRGTASISKIPYEVALIRDCYPMPGIIVVGGPKLKRALPWLTKQVDNKFVGAMDETGFTRWLMRNGF